MQVGGGSREKNGTGGREGSEGCRLTRMIQGRAHSESPLARAQNVSVLIGDAKEAEGMTYPPPSAS